MKNIVINIFAVVAGAFIGSYVNMQIINLSSSIIPAPAGVDVTNIESLKASMHLFTPKHFVMPFLAHALGTFVGAIIAATIARSHKLKFALGIGFLFFIGGVSMVVMLPAPLWFNVVDLVGAYFPMAWFGAKITEWIIPTSVKE